MRITEISEAGGLESLRDVWQALQAQCPNATPFQTWEWNAAWWRHFGSRKKLRLLLFQDERGTLVGLAPFYASRHLGTPLRRLAWLGTGNSDYMDALALPEHASAVTDSLLAHLRHTLHGWDIADLQQIRSDSPLFEKTENREQKTEGGTYGAETHAHSIIGASGEAQSLLLMEPCPYLELPPTWDAFTPRLGKKMRSNLGYYERLLLKTFPDAEFSLASEYTVREGMNALFDLHQKRWNARWLPGVLGGKRVQAFHQEVAAHFVEQDMLRLHLLRIEGSIRAALYCYRVGNRTFYYLGGFAPDMGKFSLGTLLTARAIRHAIEEGCAEFDFLRGDEPYKYRWMPQERMNHRLLLLRSREGFGGLGELPGKAGLALNRVERYVVHRAKVFVEQQGRKTPPAAKENEIASP